VKFHIYFANLITVALGLFGIEDDETTRRGGSYDIVDTEFARVAHELRTGWKELISLVEGR
jgi:hypothetical protein